MTLSKNCQQHQTLLHSGYLLLTAEYVPVLTWRFWTTEQLHFFIELFSKQSFLTLPAGFGGRHPPMLPTTSPLATGEGHRTRKSRLQWRSWAGRQSI